jgi:hypothetical protein
MFLKKIISRHEEVIGNQKTGFKLYIVEYYKPSIFFPSSLKYKAKLYLFDTRKGSSDILPKLKLRGSKTYAYTIVLR